MNCFLKIEASTTRMSSSTSTNTNNIESTTTPIRTRPPLKEPPPLKERPSTPMNPTFRNKSIDLDKLIADWNKSREEILNLND